MKKVISFLLTGVLALQPNIITVAEVPESKMINSETLFESEATVEDIISDMVVTCPAISAINTEETIETTTEVSKLIEEPTEEILTEETEPEIIEDSISAEEEYCNNYEFNVPGLECCPNKYTYMFMGAVTNTNSLQYQLLRGENAYTDEVTGIRMVDGRYCVAICQGYGAFVGDYIDIVLSDGTIIPCIIGDMRAIEHSDVNLKYQRYDYSVVEIIVDGSVFTSTEGYLNIFNSAVVKIVPVNEFYEN